MTKRLIVREPAVNKEFFERVLRHNYSDWKVRDVQVLKKATADTKGVYRAVLEKEKLHSGITAQDKRDFEIYLDNPGGQWLERQQQRARNNDFGAGAVTASTSYLPVRISKLIQLPGVRDEHLDMHTRLSRERIRALTLSMEQSGFLDDYGILVWVGPDGEAKIAEGNHRVRAAQKAGIDRVPVQFRFMAGGELASGPWNLERLVREARSGY